MDRLSVAGAIMSSKSREELLKLLSDNPNDLKSRVTLAKTYFQDGYYNFCLRELKEVSSESEEVLLLVTKIKSYLGDFSSEGSDSKEKSKVHTLAEIEV